MMGWEILGDKCRRVLQARFTSHHLTNSVKVLRGTQSTDAKQGRSPDGCDLILDPQT